MLDNLKFAQYVNEERKKLIKSTRERGVYVSDNAQLSEVVARNSEIQPYGATSTDKVSVTFLDADGTLLKREYLDIGGTATAPSNPTLDSDYLIFDSWSDTELTNITESKTIYATYTTKDNATYIFIYIPTANKAISLSFGGTITSVDWGDGTTDATKSHTYSAIGDYVIKVVGGNSITSYILGSSSNNACVLKCYLSNVITNLSYYVFSQSLLKSISLPSSITNIGSNVFASCYPLTSIYIPSSVTTIGTNAFYDCHSLTNINLPSSIKSIGQYAFEYCYSLTSITLPDSIRSFDGYTFANCSSLKSISLPSGITSLNSYMFSNCYSLTSITLPDSIISLSGTFNRCYSLRDINLPSSIQEIYSNSFSKCSSLTSINLPSGITSLDSNVFDECWGLQQVVINANSVITIQSSTFTSAAVNGTKFYVPDNLVEDYKVATNWVNFADRIYPLSSLGV